MKLLLTVAAISFVFVQNVSALGNATIYPQQGDIHSHIYLQVRSFDLPGDNSGSMFRTHFMLYVFWDTKPIVTGLDDGGNWYFDFYFYPPSEYPYSNLGNHTVYVEVWTGSSFRANFTLTFNIVQYYPPTSGWWTWWNDTPAEIKQQLTGPQGLAGPQGIQGAQGQQGLQGLQGTQGLKGEKGDVGPYPMEAVVVTAGLSLLAIALSSIALFRGFRRENRSGH